MGLGHSWEFRGNFVGIVWNFLILIINCLDMFRGNCLGIVWELFGNCLGIWWEFERRKESGKKERAVGVKRGTGGTGGTEGTGGTGGTGEKGGTGFLGFINRLEIF